MFQTYFNTIQNHFLADSEFSEITFRTAFENFLSAFCNEYYTGKFNIIHEPTKQQDKGRPDFKVSTRKEQVTVGLIETKKIGYDLKSILNSKQLENYKKLSENIILTDYLHFYLIKKGVPVLDCALFSDYDLQSKRFKVEQTRIDELTRLLKTFFEAELETIAKTKDLAHRLSEKAIFLKEYCNTELNIEKAEPGKLDGLYEAFKITLLPLIDKEYFADIYAQTLTYGLFLAALNCNAPKQELDIKKAYWLLPDSFQLIKELFHSLEAFPAEIRWAIEEIISILKVTDFAAIKNEFAEYRHKENGFNDPFIFFYEDFLKHYDKKQRELRGVYYTPEPVVSFIVRSIESILKDTFGINDGFLSNSVTLLDFATGTGTFLLYTFKSALEQAQRLGDKKTVNKILNERLLENFYGFELLVAPYVVAHLKISEYLKEQGFSLDEGNRLNIFLTNTLTNKEPFNLPLMEILSKEGREANKIKNKDILVIEGNPPYSGHSANKSDWIQEKLKIYYEVDGIPLKEKNPKWLQDDYVKFIRFAQWKMESMEKGVIGIITNHSYLDNPTFRGMRQSLMKSFDEIYILDLHGNSKKKEKCPDGSKDENIFDIQQGVAIAIFIKKNKIPKTCKIFHADLFGVRESKYKILFDTYIKNVNWEKLNPTSPFYLFKPRDENLLVKYNNGLSLQEIFNLSSVGIVTSRDDFVIDMDIKKLKTRINDFKNLKIPNHEIENRYGLGENSKFKIDKSRKIISTLEKDEYEKRFCPILYRPFDSRFLFYDDAVIERMRKDVMINMQEKNIGLISIRRSRLQGAWNFAFVSSTIISGATAISSLDINYFFPLYILSNGEEKVFFGVKEPEIAYDGKTVHNLAKTVNFTDEFQHFFSSKYKEEYEPEDILGYIYAILHSPTYRTKYIEFLKIDFPRVPFTDNEDLFRELSAIGRELYENHLLNREYTDKICKFYGELDNYKVEQVVFDEKELKVWINKDRYFQPIPSELWNFHIGGYQVLDKWLKERKKHDITLSGEDIDHFINVLNILDVTIKTMGKLDELTREWI